MEDLNLIVEMRKKMLTENLEKMLWSKMVQAKGLMPPKDAISWKHPLAKSLVRI